MSDHSKLLEDALKQDGQIGADFIGKIFSRVNSVLSYQPVVGVFGKTGAGKSSLCNAVFGKDVCEISDIAGCTRKPQEVILDIGGKGIKLLDVPGVGESNERDKEYVELYRSLLPELDLVLWVIKGDDRAFSSDETFYKNLVRPYIDKGRPFIIALNQVDKIEPFREWDESAQKPGAKQAENIEQKRMSVAKIFDLPYSCVIPVSANEKYGLVQLVEKIIEVLPADKKAIVLDSVKAENRSENSKTEAKDGLISELFNIVTDIIPVAPIAKAAVKLVTKVFSKIFSWW
ncbi:50S ribosome-binding GTPase [Pseudomonas aeruginosa]|mgnify:CR=1 FL=1|uniref:GTPase family protein n=1 Tax=Pseudomonas TaxID=286 RepID=UPI0004D441D1|nr:MULTISPECIES: GTPase [Pseudomonas]KEA15321.1 ferrous iron transporter B [Pseudomonas aeruginosa C2773C]PZQ36040.1 MAG: GTP-binding protein [Pseudomonas putida]KSL64751.1 GTP-binding protein [Pseudomonas aeruginosa]KSM79035.1 GTP-binding protein [Pseudomonas aeruginosa]MDI2560765.1 50S ribosome-binding GTPase [Pseudomonas aeruginosa]